MPNRRTPRIRSVPRAVAACLLAVALLSGGVAFATTTARAHPHLPGISAQRLIASVLRAAENPPPVSGLVGAHVDLGLPSLPQQGPQPTGLAALLSELTGDHRLRLWSSKDGYRADELLPTAERAVYVGAQGVWLWSSDAFTAYRLFDAAQMTTSQRLDAAREAERARLMHLADPLTLARDALEAVSPTTSVALGSTERVAGRPAYVLVLTPKDAGTLVGHVDIAVDATTRVPLSVGVFAKGATSPAVSAGFSSVSYRPIAPSVYRFVPPRAALVKELYQRASGNPVASHPDLTSPDLTGGAGGPTKVFGAGWSTIVAVRIDSSHIPIGGNVDGVSLGQLLPYSGPLFSVRLVTLGDHAWLLAGAVPQSALAGVESRLS